jgi:diacylglycerol kinase family enzyme
MEKLWLITNHASGSADAEKAEALEAVCEERGLVMVGRTVFPAEPIPEAAMLDTAGADTLMLFAGDGTINAALCRLDGWGGDVLILPGGTMNMLAKRLHGDADAHAIVHAAHAARKTTRLHYVEAGRHRAFVGLIAGPAASWGHARELARAGRIGRMVRAARYAWARSWSSEIAVRDGRRSRGRYNAVYVTPGEDGALDISAIAAERWADLARLGWEWLKGDWHAAPKVDDSQAREAVLASGRRAIQALFDGEEAILKSPVTIRTGLSELSFVTTVERE